MSFGRALLARCRAPAFVTPQSAKHEGRRTEAQGLERAASSEGSQGFVGQAALLDFKGF